LELKIKKTTYVTLYLLLILSIFYFTKNHFLKDYVKIENINNDEKIHTFIHKIEDTFEQMNFSMMNYTVLDKTSEFISATKQKSVDINLSARNDFLKSLDAELFIISNKQKETIYSIYKDSLALDKQKLESYLYTKLNEDNLTGFVLFDKKIFFIKKLEFHDNNTNIDSKNYIYLAKHLDNKYLNSLIDKTSKASILYNHIDNNMEKHIHSQVFTTHINTKAIENEEKFINNLNILNTSKDKSFTIVLENKMQFLQKNRNSVYIFSIVVALLIFFIFFILYNQNEKLSKKVEEKTKDLKDSLDELSIKSETLTQTMNMLNTSQHLAHIGSYNYNIKTKVSLWSDEHYIIAGFEPQSFTPTVEDYMTLVHPDDRAYVNSMLEKTILEDKTFSFEYRIVLKDGTLKYVKSTSAITKKDANNNAWIMSGVIYDMTESVNKNKELKSKEALLMEQSKMAAMGEMIGNISHQMKQPLNLISTISSSVKVDKEFDVLTDDELIKNMDEIVLSTRYLSTTIDEFKNFFDPNKKLVHTTVSSILKRSYKLINAQFKVSNIKIIDAIDDCSIDTFDVQLLQVFLNVFNNAKDELVKTDIDFLRYIFIKTYVFDKEVVIEIKDNAGGIKKEILPKVFDAYFTTKENQNGTGIGLYMSKQIVEQSLKGSITVKNEEFRYAGKNYKGASFIIRLPKKV